MANKHYPAKPDRVYLFGTCLVDLFYPEAGVAAFDLIEREGVEVIYPQNQTCCGQPAYNSGYREEALSVARLQIAAFSEDYPVVVPSGSCAGMMRHHYPELFRGEADWAAADELAQRVYELSEFLVHVLGVKLVDLGPPARVTMHTSCSARREMGVAADAEALVGQLEFVELKKPERERECCGFGGTFAVKQGDISAAMVTDKAEALRVTGADLLISGDCGCMMNIGGALDKQRVAMTHRHLASFLWERTSGKKG